jgi:hypothetical protein
VALLVVSLYCGSTTKKQEKTEKEGFKTLDLQASVIIEINEHLSPQVFPFVFVMFK